MSTHDPGPALMCIAWCPDDCDVDKARVYVGTPREIAQLHAEYVCDEQGLRREHYTVRVRAVRDDQAREWDVIVYRTFEISFNARLACLRPTPKEPESSAKIGP